MSNADLIIAEVSQALAEAGTATGDGPLLGLIIRPSSVDRTQYPPVTVPPGQFQVVGVFAAYSNEERASGSVNEADLKFVMEAGVVEPTNADKLVVKDKRYDIVSVLPLMTGGRALQYTLQARR